MQFQRKMPKRYEGETLPKDAEGNVMCATFLSNPKHPFLKVQVDNWEEVETKHGTKRDPESGFSIEFSDHVFASEVKEHLLHEVVNAQLASRRAGTRAAKERAAVRGSSRKIYKQKGTGNARHGSIRAPVFRGGGRAHPPKPQDWSYRPPRKVRIGALRSALSLIAKEGRLTVVDAMELDEVKTKTLASVLMTLEASDKTLVVDTKGIA